MDNLRLILILIGIVILALIVLFHRPPGDSRRNHARWREARREPHLGDETDREEEENSSKPTMAAGTGALWPGEASTATGDKLDTAKAPSAPVLTPDKLVYLYICRRDDRRINGSELLDAAVKAGLNFGEMNIFHRRQEGATRPVFSMANLTKPGHFDPGEWNVFDTPGVTLFLTLPAPVSALDAWDAMLATATRISELLDADLLDDSKCLLTRQRISQMREEMREYDRRHGMHGGS